MTITVSKPINLSQLQNEMTTAGVPINDGLVLNDTTLLDVVDGVQQDFTDEVAAQSVLNAHVAMRDKTDAELAAEFQGTTDPTTKQDIRDQMAGLIPREQVAM